MGVFCFWFRVREMSDQESSPVNWKLVGAGLGLGASLAASYIAYRKLVQPKLSVVEAFNSGKISISHLQEAVTLSQSYDPPRGVNRETFLQLACRHGNVQAVDALLPLYKDKLRETNIFGCNIIHICLLKDDHIDALTSVVNFIQRLPGGNQLYEELLNSKTNEKGWIPFHIAAALGRVKCFMLLSKFSGVDVNSKDLSGHTPLAIAACNGFRPIVRKLLENPECDIYATNSRCKSCLFLSCFNSHYDICRDLLEFEKQTTTEYQERFCDQKTSLVNIPDFNGNFPIHACSLRASIQLLELLIEFGAQVSVVSIAGDSVLNVCCQRNDDAHFKVLEFFAGKPELFDQITELLSRSTTFGCNPIHDATFTGNWRAIKLLLSPRQEQASKWLLAQDNDGLTPFHTLLRGIITYKAKKTPTEDLIECLNVMISLKCDINTKDYADSTPLHFLCYNPPDDELMIRVLDILLENGADPTLEDTFGWNPVHAVAQTCSHPTGLAIKQRLLEFLENRHPGFVKMFDENKPRNIEDRTFIDRSGAHNRIPIESRNAVLQNNFTMESIANYIKTRMETNQSLKIVVMAGAGISVNSGIPDFRSPGTGLYSRINPGQFSLEFLMNDPAEFYRIVKEIFGGVIDNTVHPTYSHYFYKLLADKGLLKRLYTQNIDTLDQRAGVPEQLIIEAHGSFNHARCVSCLKPVECMETFWKLVFDDQVPTCVSCGNIIRPDVVFFGEGLPDTFFKYHQSDLKEADLLIVMGTSLMVFPFSSLTNMVPLLCPRLLINKKKVGPFTKVESPNNYRDVAFVGDCDDGVRELCEILGWTDELNALMNKSPQKSSNSRANDEKPESVPPEVASEESTPKTTQSEDEPSDLTGNDEASEPQAQLEENPVKETVEEQTQ